MLKIRKNNVVTKDFIEALQKDSRCSIGKNIEIEEGASIYLDSKAKALVLSDGVSISRGAHIEINSGAQVYLGHNVTVGRDSVIAAMCSIKIGDGVGIANGVAIRDHNHRINNIEHLNKNSETSPWASGFEAAPIIIEKMAIISDGVRVLPGVRIGQNTLIGAGVHVRESLPPNCKVVGTAEKFRIIERFDGPLNATVPRSIQFNFFGDSLIDRPAIVVDNPHFDLPKINSEVTVINHETAGFYKLIQQHLKVMHPEQRFVFKNYAVGGSNIRDVQNQITQSINNDNYWDVSFVCVGINDIWRKYQGRQNDAVTLNEYSRLYQDTLNNIKKKSRLIFCIGEPLISVGNDSNNINSEIKEYNVFLKNICSQDTSGNVHYIDLFDEFKRVSQIIAAYNPDESLWIDGVHLTPIGNTLATNIIIRYLEKESIQKALFRLHSIERNEAITRYIS